MEDRREGEPGEAYLRCRAAPWWRDEAGGAIVYVVRKLWPYLGIVLAVALGIAVAPYAWWLLALAVVGLLGSRLTTRGWRVVSWLAVASVFAVWGAWLLHRGQPADALFVAALFLLACGWPWLLRLGRRVIS